MINLIQQYFRIKRDISDKDFEIKSKRQREYTLCLKRNLASSFVETIHILYEKNEDIQELKDQGIDLTNKKLILFNLGKYITYYDSFKYASDNLSNKICLVLHTDIELVSGFDIITPDYMRNKLCPIVRTGVYDNKRHGAGAKIHTVNNEQYSATMDGFIFISPVSNQIYDKLKYKPNIWGGENVVTYWFRQAGYTIETPKSIICLHRHKHNIHTNFNNVWITINGNIIDANEMEKIKKDMIDNNNRPYGGLVGGLDGCVILI